MRGQSSHSGGDPFGHLVRRHPCFSAGAHRSSGRIHLPVSPECNIRCRFCERGLDAFTMRPGMARGLLSPRMAPKVVARALELCPELAVVGVAGPGESLATSHAVEALELVLKGFPNLIGCLSSNGLNLASQVDRLAAIGVRSVSVTVNALSPSVWPGVYSWIMHGGRKVEGDEAARILGRAQEEGIRGAAALGLVVKVNSVLVPEVNEDEIEKIALWASRCGASLMNVIPLLPAGEMAGLLAPECQMIEKVRHRVEKHLPAFRHCRQCRADACGIPGLGRDLAADLYGERPVETFSHG
ncbi:MAG: radical SAM protein [Geobacteraceae bacterium]